MIYKILRKSGLGKAVLPLAMPFIKKTALLPSFDEAIAFLSSVSPDPENSCICERAVQKYGHFDLDIIIPAYNVEKYIKRCIDSALSQKTEYSFRLIIIDDGSKDGTGAIIDSYAEDSRVMIIHQENRGLSGARNRGLEYANAQYIMFLDSDDSLVDGSIQAMMACAHKNSAVLVEGAYNTINTVGKICSSVSHKSGILDCRKDFYGFAAMKIISHELVKAIQFPKDYWYEDSIMAQIIYPLAQNSGFKSYGVAEPVYNYTINPAGITANSRKRPKCIDSLWITLQLYKDRQKLGLENDQAYYEYILSMIVLSYRRAEYQSEDVKKAMFVIWKDFLEKEFSGFDTDDAKKKILQQAVLVGNFKLYTLACKLI